MRGKFAAVALTLVAAWVSTFAAGKLERADRADVPPQLLVLPNGKYLKAASLGQAPLLADMIYLWAIQYYSVYDREDRFKYVRHIFGNVVAELDPRFIDAYWMGALILSVEHGDLEGGLELLDLGFRRNPEAWMLVYLAGWECQHHGQPARAEGYFKLAEAVPGAPDYVRRTRIGMVAAQGDLRRAYGMWQEVYSDPAADAATLDIAQRQLRFLAIRIDLQMLQAAVGRFRLDNGRWPESLGELVSRGYLSALPQDPYDRPYDYDPLAGQVSAEGGRILPEGG